MDARPALRTVPSVDLTRYAGTWYEIAWLFGASREGNYWIIDLDPDYRTAVVETPGRRSLWILARAPALEEPAYQHLVDRVQDLGFPVEDLIRTMRKAAP